MDFIKLLKQELAPALGCTEPGAIALAAAKAAENLSEPVERMEVYLSRNMMKNAMNVGIAGTGETGGAMAAALGAVGGRSAYGLECLKEITQEQTKAAVQMLEEKKVQMKLAQTEEKVYVKVICYAKGEKASVTISHCHDRITKIEVNDAVQYCQEETSGVNNKEKEELGEFQFTDILSFVEMVPVEEIDFLSEAVRLNQVVVKEGLEQEYGLSVGRKLYQRIPKENRRQQRNDYIVSCTAAAVDARMAGCKYPVMSLNGSGNQGITATVPVFLLGEELELPKEKVIRGLALSALVTLYIKKYIGKLSALCACTVASSVGVSCAAVYLYGGTCGEMISAMKNMIADISGLICDGAKSTCALKIATGVNCALQCAYLAMAGEQKEVGTEGIVNEEIHHTIENLGRVATEGMTPTDQVILDIMICN